MATIKGLTAARMVSIEGDSVISGVVTGDNLILTKKNNSTVNAGNVRGPTGPVGPVGPASVNSMSRGFSAAMSANVPVSGGYVRTVLLFNSVLFNPAGWYNSATGRFTPQVAGWYRVTSSLVVIPGTSGDRVRMGLRLNASETRMGVVYDGGSQLVGGGSGSVLVFLNGTTDFIDTYATCAGSAGNFDSSSGLFQAEWVNP